jgi:hypothetical protein
LPSPEWPLLHGFEKPQDTVAIGRDVQAAE